MALDYSGSWKETYGIDKDPIRNHIIFPLIKERVLQLRHEYIADIGCGNGNAIANIIDVDFTHCVAIDVNDNFVAEAKANIIDHRVNIQSGDIFSNEIKTGSQDIVLSIFVINEVESADLFFKAMSRLLAPKGRILLVMTHPFVPLYWDTRERLGVGKNSKILGFGDYFEEHGAEYVFTLSKSSASYFHHNFEHILNGIYESDLRIINCRELTTNLGVFQDDEYWNERFFPKYFFMEISN